MKQFKGKNILEVWDYRLSSAVPILKNTGETWIVEIWSKKNPDYVEGKTVSKPLATFDTEIRCQEGDAYDAKKISACYNWLSTVRDKYSLPNIEKLKPIVAKINAARDELAAELSTGEV